ncbi:hypothetical protein [Psychrobacter sp. CMS30]
MDYKQLHKVWETPNNEKVIPEYLASYVLHMTASTILFLAKAEQALE